MALVIVLFYQNLGHVRIEGYTDANRGGSPSDRRSTTGNCVFVGGNLVSWKSKKQTVEARSSAEFEYRVIAYTICELILVKPSKKNLGLNKIIL